MTTNKRQIMSFFPSNYDADAMSTPSGGGGYFKPQQGSNKVRFVSDAIFGYVYWSTENKPVRSAKHPGANPPNLRVDESGKPDRVKPFLAAVVWSYAEQKLMIWEMTQATIMNALRGLVEHEDWGDPKGYDLTVSRTGQGLETTYTLAPSPHKPLTEAIEQAKAETPVNLAALYSGDNPFAANTTVAAPTNSNSNDPWEIYTDLIKRAGDDADKLQKATAWATKQMPDREVEIYDYAEKMAKIPF